MTIYHFVRAVVEDPDQPGELLLDLGNDVCKIVGWHPGDTIDFIDNKDGSWTLKKTKSTSTQSL